MMIRWFSSIKEIPRRQFFEALKQKISIRTKIEKQQRCWRLAEHTNLVSFKRNLLIYEVKCEWESNQMCGIHGHVDRVSYCYGRERKIGIQAIVHQSGLAMLISDRGLQ